jgi:hypothetical protein
METESKKFINDLYKVLKTQYSFQAEDIKVYSDFNVGLRFNILEDSEGQQRINRCYISYNSLGDCWKIPGFIQTPIVSLAIYTDTDKKQKRNGGSKYKLLTTDLTPEKVTDWFTDCFNSRYNNNIDNEEVSILKNRIETECFSLLGKKIRNIEELNIVPILYNYQNKPTVVVEVKLCATSISIYYLSFTVSKRTVSNEEYSIEYYIRQEITDDGLFVNDLGIFEIDPKIQLSTPFSKTKNTVVNFLEEGIITQSSDLNRLYKHSLTEALFNEADRCEKSGLFDELTRINNLMVEYQLV